MRRPRSSNAKRIEARTAIDEYVCHEGNYAMRNILSGARAQERELEAKPGNVQERAGVRGAVTISSVPKP
jgi:hypothetical protein